MKTAWTEVKEGSEDRSKAHGGGQIKDRERDPINTPNNNNLLYVGLLIALIIGRL